MLKRLLVGLATLLLVAGGAAYYLLFAPKPPAGRKAESVALMVDGRQRHYLLTTPESLRPGASSCSCCTRPRATPRTSAAARRHARAHHARRQHAARLPEGEGH
jgi:hypothetical protein